MARSERAIPVTRHRGRALVSRCLASGVAVIVAVSAAGPMSAQAPAAPSAATTSGRRAEAKQPELQAGVATTPDYVIGPDDVLTIVFWREKDMSADLTVRPDGKISLPLLNDVHAAGLTPDQLRARLTEAASKYIEEPTVTVVVKAINSRKVFIMGQVGKPGPYPLTGPINVLQLLALAGGLLEFADAERIVIMRSENGKPISFPFNYKDVVTRRNLQQNIELKPGDTVVVP